ncbi:MAG TPA: hypothetical protein VE592_13010 [Geminicoccaceae bacterium]|jgi:hypothetical protein|nr:hypothetical protein [Geminicoccaceae bacterium]
MLFLRRPYRLSDEEAVRWMREQAAPLARVSGVERVDLTRLQAPALHGGSDWQWLIEMHCRDGQDASRAARDKTCRELVADLRLLGLAPSLEVADRTEPLRG